MSGQFPGGYNNPLGAHRGQFNPQQQQQQMMNSMNTMGNVNMGQNAMQGVAQGAGGGMLPMGGYHPQAGSMMPQQQMPGTTGMGMGGGAVGVGPALGGVGSMINAGMQSPSHVQQQMQMQQQIGVGGPQQMGAGANAGMVGTGGSTTAGLGAPGASLMQQQIATSSTGTAGTSVTTSQLSANAVVSAGAVSGAMSQPNLPQTPQTANMMTISQQNPHKEINIVALSRLGQETVQDITTRFQEIFTALKHIQPAGNRDNVAEKKVQEYFRTIRLLFKRVRIIYEKCNDGYPQGMEYTHVESLIPYRDENDHRIEPSQCEEYRKVLQENQELIETVKLKNRQLREIIDRTRIIIWEINTMLSMRRS